MKRSTSSMKPCPFVDLYCSFRIRSLFPECMNEMGPLSSTTSNYFRHDIHPQRHEPMNSHNSWLKLFPMSPTEHYAPPEWHTINYICPKFFRNKMGKSSKTLFMTLFSWLTSTTSFKFKLWKESQVLNIFDRVWDLNFPRNGHIDNWVKIYASFKNLMFTVNPRWK